MTDPLPVPQRRASRMLGAVLAALAAAAWWWWPGATWRGSAPASAMPLQAPPAVNANVPGAWPISAATAAAGRSPPTSTAPASAAPTAPPVWVIDPGVGGPRERSAMALCELGTVTIDRPAHREPDAAGGDDALVARLRDAWPGLVQHLLALPDARARATGWMLALNPPMPGLPERNAALLGLVRLAQGTGDAWVMQQAVQRCAHDAATPACVGVSARHWLRLDDGNAIAWLALWNQEPAAADEALFGMARARSADTSFGRAAALLVQHWPPALPAYLLPLATIQTLGMEAAEALPSFSLFATSCRTAVARGDWNRRAACDSAAALLAGAGRDLLTRGMGSSIGRHLGWEPARRQAFEATMKLSAEGTKLDGLLSSTEPYSCAQVARLRGNLQRLAEMGEVAYWQAWGQDQARKKPK